MKQNTRVKKLLATIARIFINLLPFHAKTATDVHKSLY